MIKTQKTKKFIFEHNEPEINLLDYTSYVVPTVLKKGTEYEYVSFGFIKHLDVPAYPLCRSITGTKGRVLKIHKDGTADVKWYNIYQLGTFKCKVLISHLCSYESAYKKWDSTPCKIITQYWRKAIRGNERSGILKEEYIKRAIKNKEIIVKNTPLRKEYTLSVYNSKGNIVNQHGFYNPTFECKENEHKRRKNSFGITLCVKCGRIFTKPCNTLLQEKDILKFTRTLSTYQNTSTYHHIINEHYKSKDKMSKKVFKNERAQEKETEQEIRYSANEYGPKEKINFNQKEMKKTSKFITDLGLFSDINTKEYKRASYITSLMDDITASMVRLSHDTTSDAYVKTSNFYINLLEELTSMVYVDTSIQQEIKFEEKAVIVPEAKKEEPKIMKIPNTKKAEEEITKAENEAKGDDAHSRQQTVESLIAIMKNNKGGISKDDKKHTKNYMRAEYGEDHVISKNDQEMHKEYSICLNEAKSQYSAIKKDEKSDDAKVEDTKVEVVKAEDSKEEVAGEEEEQQQEEGSKEVIETETETEEEGEVETADEEVKRLIEEEEGTGEESKNDDAAETTKEVEEAVEIVPSESGSTGQEEVQTETETTTQEEQESVQKESTESITLEISEESCKTESFWEDVEAQIKSVEKIEIISANKEDSLKQIYEIIRSHRNDGIQGDDRYNTIGNNKSINAKVKGIVNLAIAV